MTSFCGAGADLHFGKIWLFTWPRIQAHWCYSFELSAVIQNSHFLPPSITFCSFIHFIFESEMTEKYFMTYKFPSRAFPRYHCYSCSTHQMPSDVSTVPQLPCNNPFPSSPSHLTVHAHLLTCYHSPWWALLLSDLPCAPTHPLTSLFPLISPEYWFIFTRTQPHRPSCVVVFLPCVFAFELLPPKPSCLTAPACKPLTINKSLKSSHLFLSTYRWRVVTVSVLFS